MSNSGPFVYGLQEENNEIRELETKPSEEKGNKLSVISLAKGQRKNMIALFLQRPENIWYKKHPRSSISHSDGHRIMDLSYRRANKGGQAVRAAWLESIIPKNVELFFTGRAKF